MRKLNITFSFLVLVVTLSAVKSAAAQGGRPTFDFLLFTETTSAEVVRTSPQLVLRITDRGGPVTATTQVTANGLNGEINLNRIPMARGVTMTQVITFVTFTDYEVTGTLSFDDDQRSTIEFETLVPGALLANTLVNGVAYQRGAAVAYLKKGTGQFANMDGVITISFISEVNGPNASNVLVFRLFPKQ